MKLSHLFILFFAFLLIPTVLADPPFIGDFTGGYIIEFPTPSYRIFGEDLTLNIHVYNKTDGVKLTPSEYPISCSYHLYDREGRHILKEDNIAAINDEWQIVVNRNNFTYIGEYSNIVSCNSSVAGGFIGRSFEVKSTGNLSLFLILSFVSVILLLLAFIFKQWIMGFIAGVAFILSGMYAMIYGVAGFSDLYTQGIAIILIGIGFILTVAAGFDAVNGGE